MFNIRDQESAESIDSYVTVLRTLVKSCNFCDCLHDTLIRDRIVIGVRDQQTRKRLIQERKLTLTKCIDICRGAEASSSQLKVMNNATDKVHGLSAQRSRYTRPPWCGKATPSQSSSSRGGARPKYTSYSKEPQLCKFCAKVHNMKKEDCPAWGRTCKLCHELNHFPGSQKCPKNKVHTVITSGENEESDTHEWIGCVIIKDELDVVNCVHAGKPTDIFAEIIVNEKPMRFHVDSGASVNTLPMKYVRTSEFIPCNKTLQMWNNSEFKPVGTLSVILKLTKVTLWNSMCRMIV